VVIGFLREARIITTEDTEVHRGSMFLETKKPSPKAILAEAFMFSKGADGSPDLQRVLADD
jgi:hypothetical protein